MKKKYEGVIFDLDGTLIQSMWVWDEVDKVYLNRFGITPPSDMDKILEGKSFTETAIYFKERFNIPDSIEEIKASWNEIAKDFYMHQVKLKSYAKEFIELLSQKNVKMGIATSNSIELLNAVLEALQIKKYFNRVRTCCEVEKGKPHPYIYLKVSEELEVDPSACLVFEDIPNGARAGKSAGMDVWGIEDGQKEAVKKELIKISDHFITDYKEAIEYFS